MAKNRIDIQRSKKDNEVDAARRLIAVYLSESKEPLARIHAERILRERSQLEAFDIIQTFVDLLAASNAVFSMHRDFDPAPIDLKESVASLVYASARLNIPELHTVTDMLRAHFGPSVTDPLLRLEGPNVVFVNKLLARNLERGAPDGYRVLEELANIAAEHQLSWIPPPEEINLDHPGDGSGSGGGHGGGGSGYYRPERMPYGTSGVEPSAPPQFASHQPMNIPGHNPYDSALPYGIPPGVSSEASAPPSAPPPPAAPFDPSGGASGTFYPFPGSDINGPGGYAPPSQGGFPPPPPPPPASFLNDDALEAKLRNMQDNNRRL